MGCLESLLKYIVFLFNLVFFISGCIIIGFGAYLQIEMKNYFDFLGSSYVNSAIVLIIIGVVIALITFFGCCGACTENSCMMYTFGGLMGLLLLAELGAGITILVFKNDIPDVISDAMKDGLTNYGKGDDYAGVTQTWDVVQTDFECCGVESYKDWKNATAVPVNSVPDSCCKLDSAGCGKDVMNDPEVDDKIYVEGCFNKFEEFIMDQAGLVGGIAAGIAVIQLLGVLVSCCLGKRMGERDNYV